VLPPASSLVYVEDLSSPELSPSDLHHLKRVMRLRPGERVIAADGKGGYVECAFTGSVELEPVGAPSREPEPPYAVGVGIAKVAHGKVEAAVRALCEVGVDRLAVFWAARSQGRPHRGERDRELGRLLAVVLGACRQARRAAIPEVAVFGSTVEMLRSGFLPEPLLAASPRAEADPAALFGARSIVVGPEGGFEQAEVATVAQARLPTAVMRTETAAVYAGAALTLSRAMSSVTLGGSPASLR
jgi:16S rRNA (uracil1498-N3)-methyltransferase